MLSQNNNKTPWNAHQM